MAGSQDSEKLKTIFAKNLNYYMNKDDINTAELSRALSYSFTTVSDWVHGRKYPRMDKVQAIADYFGIMKSDLTEEKTPASEGGRKLQDMVNGDQELTEYLEMLRNRPECRMLFSLSKDASKEDVEKAVAIIEALRSMEGRG